MDKIYLWGRFGVITEALAKTKQPPAALARQAIMLLSVRAEGDNWEDAFKNLQEVATEATEAYVNSGLAMAVTDYETAYTARLLEVGPQPTRKFS